MTEYTLVNRRELTKERHTSSADVSDLPKVNPLKLPQTMHEIVNAINQIPPIPEYYSERKENQ